MDRRDGPAYRRALHMRLKLRMFPITHAVIAIGAAKAGEPFLPARLRPPDLRFAALGGLLPDLVDKPLVWFLVPSIPDDHFLAHTLWFPLLLLAPGLLLAARASDTRLLLLGLGALTHLIFDPVGGDPHKLFWPLFGTSIPYAGAYLFDSPISGLRIEALLMAALLILPHAYEPFRRRLSNFAAFGTI